MKKKVGIIKRIFSLLLVFLLSINSFAAVVSDNDGSAFITKAEFDSLKNSFQSQIDQYNTSIDSKIDGAIAQYLAGIRTQLKPKVEVDLLNEGVVYKTWAYDFKTDWDFYNSNSSTYTLTYSPGLYKTYYYTYGNRDSNYYPQNHWETQENCVETCSFQNVAYYSANDPKPKDSNLSGLSYVVRYSWRRFGWSATNCYGSSYYAKQDYLDSNDFPRTVNQNNIKCWGQGFDSGTKRAFPMYIINGHINDSTQINRPTTTTSGAYIYLYKPWDTWTCDMYRFKDSETGWQSLTTANIGSKIELKSGPRVREGNLMRLCGGTSNATNTTLLGKWSFVGATTEGSECRNMPTKMYWNCFAFPDQIYWEDAYIKLWGKWNKRSTDGDLNIHMNWTTGKNDVEPSMTKNVVTYNKTKSSVTSGSTWCFFDSQVSAPGCKAGSVGLAIDINSTIGKNETPFTWLDFYGLPQIDLGYELFTTDGESQGIKWFWVNGVVNNSLLGGL